MKDGFLECLSNINLHILAEEKRAEDQIVLQTMVVQIYLRNHQRNLQHDLQQKAVQNAQPMDVMEQADHANQQEILIVQNALIQQIKHLPVRMVRLLHWAVLAAVNQELNVVDAILLVLYVNLFTGGETAQKQQNITHYVT